MIMHKGVRIVNLGEMNPTSFDFIILKTIAENLGSQINKRITFNSKGTTVYGILRMIEIDCQEDLTTSRLFLFIESCRSSTFATRNWYLAGEISLYSEPTEDIVEFYKRIAPEVFKQWKI